MLRWAIVAFVVVPLTELYLLVGISRAIGFWETLAITLITGVVGGSLARREGLRVWRSWHRALQEGRPPTDGIADGALILLGGALLVTPGVLTDAFGLCLLLPATRRPLASTVAGLLRREFERRVVVGGVGAGPPRRGGGPTVETTGEEVPPSGAGATEVRTRRPQSSG